MLRIKNASGQTDLSIEIVGTEPNGDLVLCMAHFSYDGFEVKIKFSTLLGDFQSFADELEALHKTLRGQAQFQSMEDNLSFRLLADEMGHIDIGGYLRHKGYEVKTDFLIHSDQTFLPELVREAKEVLV